MVKNDLAKLKKHFEKNIASKSIIYFIGFLAFSILLSCIRQSIQDAANNPQIKIVALIVLTYLAFKSEVIARNEQIAARAFANSSEKKTFKTKLVRNYHLQPYIDLKLWVTCGA